MGANLKYFLAVNRIPGIGPTRIKKALDHFGDIRSFWLADRSQLFKIDGFNGRLVDAVVEAREKTDLDEEYDNVIDSGYKIVTIEDENYPPNLKNIYDPPPVLYIDGELLPTDGKAIAIVGTRIPTYYGKEIARKLSIELTNYGFTIVSGLALGIDSEAHFGALEAGGRTISVYGSAIDQIYPRSNIGLAKKIAKSGANVSEFPLGQKPDKWTFPQRNRIISGLSLGVVVIEGTLDSGALITAKIGLEQGREVFAVPGNVKSQSSKGPHSLIKEGAKLVEGIDDILEELHIYVEKKERMTLSDYGGMSKNEKRILSVLSHEPRIIDNIVSETGLSPSEVLRTLSIFEMKKYVKQLPGKSYVLI